jgi:hypothetical protein
VHVNRFPSAFSLLGRLNFSEVHRHFMRARHLLLFAVCAASLAAPARAQTGPVIAIPGKVGVPVVMNGVIVDGAVIWGDWGLARPTFGVVVDGVVAFAAPPQDSRSFYPKTGRKPRVGRQEVEPKHNPHPRPTSFRRDWSAGSNFNAPVTEYPPFDPPPVILAPRGRRF